VQNLKKYYKNNPLTVILLAGLLIRLVSVIFAKGFGWIDDQFLIVEIAQSWVDGTDYYRWLPDTPGNNGPVKFSFFYTGIIYYIFSFLEIIGIDEPQSKMYVVRLLHALWSLLIIKFGYKITLILSNKKNANQVGWILAVLWLFPFLSVRNLVEFVSIPLVLWTILLVIDKTKNTKLIYWLLAGMLMGFAFNIRLQTALLAGGMGLVFLFQKKIGKALIFGGGFILIVAIFQGLLDYYFWGYPFAQLAEYVGYNMQSASNYTVGPWYVYILFILGVLVPPFSLALFTGFVVNWKKLAIIFVPVLIFLLFHSYYPNKQERFVITILPLIIISGVIGWNELLLKLNSVKWNKANHIFIIIFWVLNLIALLPISSMYSKKARVESMHYLSAYKQTEYFVIENVNRDVLRFPPMYYLDKWIDYDAIMQKTNIDDLAKSKQWKNPSKQPAFILFFQPKNIDQRVENLKKYLPGLVHETTIEPGTLDRLLHWLNPINANENIFIYRNTAVIPDKIEK
jgi:hypothetical protein